MTRLYLLHAKNIKKLQPNYNIWTRRWRIKLNETKLVHINFTNKREHQSIRLNNAQIPYGNAARYLGITLDSKFEVSCKTMRKVGNQFKKKNVINTWR